MLWLIWIGFMLLVPTVAGAAVWYRQHQAAHEAHEEQR
jgi:hypothetical protein